jgi:phosphoserine phosphatase RsbU/P
MPLSWFARLTHRTGTPPSGGVLEAGGPVWRGGNAAHTYRAGLIASTSALLVYVVATSSEIAVIDTLRPTELELTWISDAILATAFGIAVYLWLHLKWSRLALQRLERERIVLDTQLSIAAHIQRSLLTSPPADAGGVRWAARLKQAGRIGGDLYDFVRPTPQSWLLLVGDVSGKGIPAALVLASVRTLFRILANEISDPGVLVDRLSRSLYDDNGGSPYLTCFVARLDLESRRLDYTNAGHPAGVIVDGGRTPAVLRLGSSGPPAGLFPDTKYETASLVLSPGVAAVFVTDGITEAFDELGESSADAIPALLGALPRPLAPDAICDALMARTAAALAADGSGWQDDRTVVALVLDA